MTPQHSTQHLLLRDLLRLEGVGVQVVHHADVDDLLGEVGEDLAQLVGLVVVAAGQAVGHRSVARVVEVV